jgi:predicted nucleotidyltransferase
MFEKLKQRWQQEATYRVQQADLRKAALHNSQNVFEAFGLKKVVLFGSVAQGQSHPESDLDVLVMPLPQPEYWRFRAALQEATGFEVDVYTQADDPSWVAKILARGEVIYETQPGITQS